MPTYHMKDVDIFRGSLSSCLRFKLLVLNAEADQNMPDGSLSGPDAWPLSKQDLRMKDAVLLFEACVAREVYVLFNFNIIQAPQRGDL